jgi:Patatin-like phospholipase
MASDRTFELGLVMAGAISAGAYTAGVLDFLFEALDAYEDAKLNPGWDGPTHAVRVPVMTGASAGGMTSAISALQAFRDFDHVRPSPAPPPPPERNRLYSSWVKEVSLDALLDTADLQGTRRTAGVKSALCCDVLDGIVDRAFDKTPMRNRAWIGRDAGQSLRVMMTLTNLRGSPYAFPLFGAESDETYGMLNHGDYFDFTVSANHAAPPGSMPLDVSDFTQSDWEVFKTTALATGAFPVGLAPRLIKRTDTTFYYKGGTIGFEDAQGGFVRIDPAGDFKTLTPYDFVSVDGGIIDNAPLELARRYLSGGANIQNPRNGLSADKAVVLVAPFPNFVKTPGEDDGDRLIHMLPRLLSALIDQSRFKPGELQLAASDECFSRFMISPTREGLNPVEAKRVPIACGVLGGFGGFLHESFRRHDYLLGRRNAQAFLRWNFALPEGHPFFAEVPINKNRWWVRNVDKCTGSVSPGQEGDLKPKLFATEAGSPSTPGYPIIPLVGSALDPVEIPAADMPRPDDIDTTALSEKIRKRAAAVITTFVDVDLRMMAKGANVHPGLELWIGGAAAHLLGDTFLADLAAKKAMDKIVGAIDDVRGAFP